jgi:exosome complex RNA-binding protein Rrp42 (RNase PH superfamily)
MSRPLSGWDIKNEIFVVRVSVMVFNATFNNISVISWQSVLLVEETKVPGKTTNPSQITNKLNNAVSSTPRPSGIRTNKVGGDSR